MEFVIDVSSPKFNAGDIVIYQGEQYEVQFQATMPIHLRGSGIWADPHGSAFEPEWIYVIAFPETGMAWQEVKESKLSPNHRMNREPS